MAVDSDLLNMMRPLLEVDVIIMLNERFREFSTSGETREIIDDQESERIFACAGGE